MAEATRYLIYSREHNAWWKPNSFGYTIREREAGRYTKLEAERICRDAGLDHRGGVNEFAYQVRAVNSHDALLAALKELIQATTAPVPQQHGFDMPPEFASAEEHELDRILMNARSAIALAEPAGEEG